MFKRPTERTKQMALGVAFGAIMSGSVISGIPTNVPNLSRALSCGNCSLQLKRGLPVDFVAHMTDEQKKAFKKAMKKRGGK